MSSLAFIEVKNFISAVEAADTVLKVSDSLRIKIESSGNSFIIVVGGKSPLVKKAFENVLAFSKRWGKYLSSNIIEDPNEELFSFILGKQKKLPAAAAIGENGKEKELKTSKALQAVPTEPVKKEKKLVPDKKSAKAEARKQKPKAPVIKKEEKEPRSKKKSKSAVKDNVPAVRTERKKKKAEQGNEGLFGQTLFDDGAENDTISRLRREALGQKVKPRANSEAVPNVPSEINLQELEILNVWDLRRRARNTPGFPIQGRQISKANRGELLDHFKKMV